MAANVPASGTARYVSTLRRYVSEQVAARWPTPAKESTDPCLVIVTDDGDWLEIDRWYH